MLGPCASCRDSDCGQQEGRRDAPLRHERPEAHGIALLSLKQDGLEEDWARVKVHALPGLIGEGQQRA